MWQYKYHNTYLKSCKRDLERQEAIDEIVSLEPDTTEDSEVEPPTTEEESDEVIYPDREELEQYTQKYANTKPKGF